jgi:hypothetical protein
MKSKLNLIALLILTISLTACNQNEKPKNFDYGHTENGKYLNSFFGLELDIPSGWVVQTREETENLTEMGKEFVAGDDENLKAVIDASKINSANLISVFQYEVGSAVDYNPNFMLVAENIKNSPGTKTGSDYLFQARKFLAQSKIEYSHIDDKFEKKMINGQEFYVMNCNIEYAGLSINQIYYSTIVDGFAMNVIVSYTTDEQKSDLDKMLNSMAFN